jgi:DNA repair exonuclease SbcCD nuclease subunit
MKPAFIVFSDIQMEDWTRFSTDHSRLHDNGVILSKVFNLCVKYGVDAIFAGDMFDNPKQLSNYLLNYVFIWFNKFKEAGIKIYCISGNHDQCDKNSLTHTSPNYINMLSTIYDNIINLDLKTITHGPYILHGICYMSDNSDVVQAISNLSKKIDKTKTNILILHTHLPGAKEPNGYEVETNMPKTLYRILAKFDLVISGHIHKPQMIYKNTYHLGATHQQRTSDSGTTMGIWKLYPTMKMKFIDLGMPEFKYYKEDEEPKNKSDFWIPIPKEIKDEEGAEEALIFKPKTKAKILAREYLKVKNIKSKTKLKALTKYLENNGVD